MADERVNSRWNEPFLVNPDELTPEQLATVNARNAALREYYRTGDPTAAIREGALSPDFKPPEKRR